MLVLGRDADVAEWLGPRLQSQFVPPFTAIGITDDGTTLVGGMVFHTWNGSNLETAAVLDRRLRRGEIRGLWHYVFRQLGARRLTFRTTVQNQPALRFLRRHARFEVMLRDWFPSGNAFQFVLFPDTPGWQRWQVE